MQLILTRHAKSSWDESGLSDHDRPLAKRGRQSADAIGRWLLTKGYIPQIIQCSTAKRTQETWLRIEKFIAQSCHVSYQPGLYHGHPESILQCLIGAAGSPVMVIGHNPGIGSFAESIVQEVPSHPAFFQYPTAATLVCEFPVNRWSEITLGTAEVLDFVVPRELV